MLHIINIVNKWYYKVRIIIDIYVYIYIYIYIHIWGAG